MAATSANQMAHWKIQLKPHWLFLQHCMFRAHDLVYCQPELIAAPKLHPSLPSPINLSTPTLHLSISKPSIAPSSTPPYTKVCLPSFSQERRRRSKGAMPMISAKRLIQMAKKWQRMAAVARKRLTTPLPVETEGPSTSMACKGHCVVYSADGRRFEVPLAYLSMTIFSELLRQSQEEFGFSSDDGRITLPCDATVMEYMISLLRRDASEEVERALLSSMVKTCNYGSNGCVEAMALSRQVAVSSF